MKHVSKKVVLDWLGFVFVRAGFRMKVDLQRLDEFALCAHFEMTIIKLKPQ